MKIFVTLYAGDRKAPYPIKFKVGVRDIGIAEFDPATRHHFIRLPLETFLEHALSIARQCASAGNVWYVSKVEVEDNGSERENELAQDLDKLQTELSDLQRQLLNAIRENESLKAEVAKYTVTPPATEAPTGPTSVSEIARQEEDAGEQLKNAPTFETETITKAVEELKLDADSVPPIALTEEYLKTLGGVRALRKVANEQGVPNYKALNTAPELIQAIISHVNKPADPADPAPVVVQEQPAAPAEPEPAPEQGSNG